MNSDALVKLVAEHLRPGLHCYVLLDPLAVPEKSDQSLISYLKSVLGEAAMTRVLRPDLPHVPELHPVLACLSTMPDQPCASLLAMTAQVAERDMFRRKRYVCGWLLSEASSNAVASHITALCRLPDASGTCTFYPVHEPLRLELLAGLLERPDQGPWWPIERWIFMSSGGRLAGLKGQPQPLRGLPANALPVQDEVGLIENVLSAWRALLTPTGASEPPPMPPFAAIRTSNHIEVARSLGLSAKEDIEVLALHLLWLHPLLHTLQPVRDMVDRVVRQKCPLAPLLAQFTDGSWKHLLAHLPKHEVHS